MQQLGDRSRDRVGDRSSSDAMADTLKFECERRAVVQDRTTYGIAMEGVYLCWLLLRLISTGRWQKGRSGCSRRTGGCLSLANVRQRRRQQPRTRKPLAHMTRTGDSHSTGPLSRATHQLRLFHDVYGWPPLLFSACRPVCRTPP